MGSIGTSTQSVPIIPHKLAPELSRCFFIKKLVKKYGRKTVYTEGALWYVDAGRGRACGI